MNGIKLGLLVLLIFAAISGVHAQERENRQNVTFDSISYRFSTATGWLRWEGKWFDHGNVISTQYVGDTSRYSNFYWFQTYTFKYKGDKYYALVYQYLTGAYKYPSLQVDWETYIASEFLIFKSDMFDFLKQAVAKQEGIKVTVPTTIWSTEIPVPIYENLLSTQVTSLFEDRTHDIKSFSINSQRLNGKDIVRFKLPSTENLSFEDSYFEADRAEFEKIFSLAIDNTPEGKAREIIAKEKAKQNKVASWQVSDTVYQNKCKVIDKTGQIKHPFDWAVMSSFKSDGKQMYCFYFRMLNSVNKDAIFYLVLSENMYVGLKNSINAGDGKAFNASSTLYDDISAEKRIAEDGAYVGLARQHGSSIEHCLSVNASKGKVRFMLPSISSCNDNPDFSNKGPGYYECDIATFMNLFKW